MTHITQDDERRCGFVTHMNQKNNPDFVRETFSSTNWMLYDEKEDENADWGQTNIRANI